jgi:hypothetical protein
VKVMGNNIKVGDRVQVVKSKRNQLDCTVCFVSSSDIGVEYTDAENVTRVGMYPRAYANIRRL